MHVTKIDPAISMFDIEEIPTIVSVNKKGTTKVFDMMPEAW